MDTCIDNQSVMCEHDNRSDKPFPMLIELVQNKSKLKEFVIQNQLIYLWCYQRVYKAFLMEKSL